MFIGGDNEGHPSHIEKCVFKVLDRDKKPSRFQKRLQILQNIL